MKALVLIADHDTRIAEATRRCLLAHGCDAAVATNGLQCVEQLTKVEPTVVVLDPDILWGGGEGVLEWMIGERPPADPMVVIADGPGSSPMPDRLQGWIDFRIPRPESLQGLVRFVDQLEAVALWSELPHCETTWKPREEVVPAV